MKDRVPTYPGRVQLTPVPGQANTYDMVRADEPMQEGDPLCKATLLPDDVATALGLTGNSQVADGLKAVKGYLSTRGLIRIIVNDASGVPVSGVSFSISPSVTNFSNVVTDVNGECYIGCDFGSYTLTPAAASLFLSVSPTSKAITVIPGTITIASFTANKITSGRYVITSGTTITIPPWVSEIDLFAVGGGGGKSTSNNAGSGTGGCGGAGYTSTKLNLPVAANDQITLTIGAAGASSSSTGGTGGTTNIQHNGASVCTANGGLGGKPTSTTTGGTGGNGGSGGGGGMGFYSVMGFEGSGGSNGSNGAVGSDGSGPGGAGGIGQGTTTREFGEVSGTLYSYGGSGSALPSAYGNGGGAVAANQGCAVIRW